MLFQETTRGYIPANQVNKLKPEVMGFRRLWS